MKLTPGLVCVLAACVAVAAAAVADSGGRTRPSKRSFGSLLSAPSNTGVGLFRRWRSWTQGRPSSSTESSGHAAAGDSATAATRSDAVRPTTEAPKNVTDRPAAAAAAAAAAGPSAEPLHVAQGLETADFVLGLDDFDEQHLYSTAYDDSALEGFDYYD